jgi:hypothetical protein
MGSLFVFSATLLTFLSSGMHGKVTLFPVVSVVSSGVISLSEKGTLQQGNINKTRIKNSIFTSFLGFVRPFLVA